jgi:serine phosphatase RsbU (regulator of sigma subunit)
MTMIVSTGLGRIVRDEGCRSPAEILSRLNRYVKTTLQQDTESARTDDGLDASICSIRLHAREIIFSGARHPLWIIDDEFREIRGDRMGLGYRKSDPGYQFTEHRIALTKKTSCYLFTDGFPDQLGGDQLIPFGRKRLKRILFNNRRKSMKEQRSILISYFNDHKNDSEMTDDVTMVGFQLSETATDPAAVIDAFLKRQGSTPKSSP